MKNKREKSINLAVFGDIHGRIALMYTLVHRWQEETGESIDAILQVGDMGAFPDHQKIDKATRKHALRDKDELDFAHFCRPTKKSSRYLNRPEAPVTFFIRGNHEDFDYLDSFSGVSAVDPWGKLRYIDDSTCAVLSFGSSLVSEDSTDAFSLVVGGFGGVEPPPRLRGLRARKQYRKVTKNPQPNKYFDPESVSTAFGTEPQVDILMTHEGPRTSSFPQGSEKLAELSEHVHPAWHFFGHHHVVLKPTEDSKERTRLVGLEHLDFDKKRELKEDAWGILSYSPNKKESSFRFANRETMPWLEEIKRRTYHRFL